MRTETTLLEGDRARLDVEVPAERVEHDLQHTLGHLAHQVRVPGFRKGRVPPAVVLQRLGREEVLDETLREHLERWYSDAVNVSRIKPIEQPDIDWKVLPDEGEPFRFSATVRLRPKGVLPDPLVLEAPRREDEVPQELVERELENLRKEGSPLVPVTDRAAAGGRLRRARLPRPRRRRQRPAGRRRRGLPRRARRRAHPPADGAGRRRHARRRAEDDRRRLPARLPVAEPRRQHHDVRDARAHASRSAISSRSTTTSPAPSPSSTRWTSCAPTSSA